MCLLELQREIALDDAQVAKIQKLYLDMKAKAQRSGEQLIQLEKELGERFRDRTIDDQTLRETLQKIARVRAELRYIHLATHLQTPEILSAQQIRRYNQLRGYASHDPCARVPSGHDPAMWRKHNGCN